MAPLAENLLQDALEEIVRRDPSFFARQEVGLAPLAELAERARAAAPAGLADDEIEQALFEGFCFFRDRGVRTGEGEGPQRRLAQMLAASAVDARAAARGLVALPAPALRPETFEQVLGDDYERRTTASGTGYVVRRRGARWLLLINAIGIPLGVWARLLGDRSHDYRILAVESAGWDLIDGGQRADSDISGDTARVIEALDAEGIDRLDVLGWCSGGRGAVHLAAEQPERVRRLILTSASFRGCGGSAVKPTQFETDIAGIFDSVNGAPQSAGFLSDLLVNSSKLAQPPVEDALLFRLPAKAMAAALVAPLASGEALQRYARRVVDDKTHTTEDALSRVRSPILVISGRHDHVVSNEHTWEVLNAHAGAPSLSNAVISGAGHYAYDLQYPYFRALLDAFTEDRPFAAARISALPRPA